MRWLVRNSWRGLKDNWGLHLATLVVLSGTFAVISVFMLIESNLERLLTRWGDSVQMEVFLSEGAKPVEVSQVRQFLTDSQLFQKMDYVSSDQAAESFRQRMGHLAPDLLHDPEFGNPIPASFQVTARMDLPQVESLESWKSVAQKLMQMPAVEDVSYGQGWVENYVSFLRVVRSAAWFLILLLLAGSLLVVSNAIRTSIEHRRQEIEVLELIGAPLSRIRWPYYIEGFSLGFLASVVGLFTAYGVFRAFSHWINGELRFWNLGEILGFLQVQEILGLLLMGIVFGFVGAFICVRRLATGWAAAEGST